MCFRDVKVLQRVFMLGTVGLVEVSMNNEESLQVHFQRRYQQALRLTFVTLTDRV